MISEHKSTGEPMHSISLETPVFDPRTGHRRSHIEWAVTIARKVRQKRSLFQGSSEEELLESEAKFELVRKLPDFDYAKVPSGGDPDMAFRGWVKEFVRCACEREADRIRNGGTYNTTRTPYAVRVDGKVPESPSVREEERRLPAEGMCQDFGDVRCRLYDQELAVESEPDLHTWAVAVGDAELKSSGWMWWLGDLARYGYKRWGKDDARAKLASMGFATDTVRQAYRVCEKFAGTRVPGVGFTHHRAVERLPLDDALALLARAKRQRLSRRELEELVPRAKPTERPVLTRVDRERAPAVAARCGLTEEQVLEVLRLFRSVKVG